MADKIKDEYKVLTSAIHVYEDDLQVKAKSPLRKLRGELVKIDPALNDIERLKSLGAIGTPDDPDANAASVAAASQDDQSSEVPAEPTK